MTSPQQLIKPFHLLISISNRNALAQVLRISDGHIVTSASTCQKKTDDTFSAWDAKKGRNDKVACSRLGELVAEKAMEHGIPGVHWRRKRGQKYHGRVAAIIEGIRAKGLPLV